MGIAGWHLKAHHTVFNGYPPHSYSFFGPIDQWVPEGVGWSPSPKSHVKANTLTWTLR